MSIPTDNPETFPNIPLQGHLCSLRRGDQKFYWRVERLVAESESLEKFEVDVDDLLNRLGNSTWFGPNENPTINAILSHVQRAMSADLSYPLILSADGKIMDGSHRLFAASLKGIKKISVVQFSIDPEPDHIEVV